MGSVWTLLGFGFVGMLILSVLVGLAIGAILGQISREVSRLLEFEPSDRTTNRRAPPAPAAWSATSSLNPSHPV
jgi:hypothetical protein